jgi:hypothetical protein
VAAAAAVAVAAAAAKRRRLRELPTKKSRIDWPGSTIDPANLLLAATLFANDCVSPFASGSFASFWLHGSHFRLTPNNRHLNER